MSEEMTPELWRRYAERFSESSRFVGHWLARYCNKHHRTTGDLAREWGTTAVQLHQMAICGVPRRSHWTADLDAIANIGGIDAGRAALLFRDAEGLR